MKVLLSLCFAFYLSLSLCHAQTDTIAPDIHLIGSHCIAICVGTQYADSGYFFSNAADSFAELVITVDGSFVTQGTQAAGVYKLRFKAVDKAGNIGFSEWRFINVRDSSQLPNCTPIALNCGTLDTVPPVITLVGDMAASVCTCIPYEDAGYIVSDNIDSAKDINIDTSGTFLTYGSNVEGVYTLIYKVTDRTGNYSYSPPRYIFVRNPCEFPCTSGVCCLSVKENAFLNKVLVYPNPARDELFIQTNQLISTISIYNISSQKLQEININQNLNMPYKIDTKHFPAGIYMVQLKNASGIINKKIEIKR